MLTILIVSNSSWKRDTDKSPPVRPPSPSRVVKVNKMWNKSWCHLFVCFLFPSFRPPEKCFVQKSYYSRALTSWKKETWRVILRATRGLYWEIKTNKLGSRSHESWYFWNRRKLYTNRTNPLKRQFQKCPEYILNNRWQDVLKCHDIKC